jgi:hypothetical protein
MPNELSLHNTVTFCLCRGDWCSKRGFSSAQYLKFCLLRYPLHLMLPSLQVVGVVCPSFAVAWCKSPFTYSNHEAVILAPFECWMDESAHPFDMPSSTDRRWLCRRATRILSTLSGLRSDHGGPLLGQGRSSWPKLASEPRSFFQC